MMSFKTLKRKTASFLESDRFLWVLLILFVVQALWIAFTGRYPMAFDEGFHLGIIRIYAHQYSPFLASHPAGADAFGAVARDPSYLYHYLMSFPYRFFGLFTHNESAKIILLRLLNIGIAVFSLPLWKKVLRAAGASKRVAHSILFAYILIPVVPLLSAQINYDNLLLPLSAIAIYWTIQISQELHQKTIDWGRWVKLLTILLLLSITKYAFLPIFLGIVVWLCIVLVHGRNWRTLTASVITSWRNTSTFQKSIIWVSFLLVSTLFVQRIGVNVVRYGTPAPDCAQVLRYDQCKSYGPWIRDYNFNLQKGDFTPSLVTYAGKWFYGMWFRLFFAVDGPATQFQTRGPLLLPGLAFIAASVVGILGLLWKFTGRRHLSFRPTAALALISLIYVLLLFYDQYKLYVYSGMPVAINGRYLLPVLPYLMLFVAIGLGKIQSVYSRSVTAFIVALYICFLLGGGVLTFIVRSNAEWYWDNEMVENVNRTAQKVVSPLLPGANKPLLYFKD